jgi:hypothetical protein
MPRDFSPATAEQVVAAVEAIVSTRQSAKAEFVASFSDITEAQAGSALELATDLGFLALDGAKYTVASPLCRFLVTPSQMEKAAVLRVLLESYEPFVVFRERLVATGSAPTAAQQTKVTLDLNAHREEIKDTLLSLGTYSHALITEGGGRYSQSAAPPANTLEDLMAAAQNAAAAEGRVRQQIGAEAAAAVSRDEVLVPLSEAWLRAAGADGRGAVVEAGNAVESFLTALAGRTGTNITGANGINAKLDKFQAAILPKKLVNVGKYLGHVRNAADHGVDPEVGAAWSIRSATGVEYVYVACSFIAAIVSRERGHAPEI